MPQIVRGIRHNDIVATLGRNGFELYRGTCTRSTAQQPAVAKLEAMTRRAGSAAGSLDRMSDSLDALVPRVHALADRRRAILAAERERAAARGGIVSATAGYVRDAAGNRVRPMTPADLQAIADEHYGRVRS